MALSRPIACRGRHVAEWARALRVLLLGAAVAAPTLAHAWGEAGHRITGHIAARLLTPEARAGVTALMGSADLATFSLYLDTYKTSLDKKMPGSRQWHYDDRPVCDDKAPKASYCQNGNCASTQITRHYRDLIDDHSSKGAKQFAIYALVHLVGDVHQPLHASDHDDRGGNDIRVRYLVGADTRRTNLHSAWDTDFVKLSFSTQQEKVIAQDLVQRFGDKIPGWQTGSANGWLEASYKLSNDLAYGRLLDSSVCNADPSAAPVSLKPEYVDAAKDVIPEQLAMAGARIAYLLNRAFAK